MPSGKEIRRKIKSVENTRKITKAMEMVAASKMRKAQDRMRASRPYGEKIRRIAGNLSHAIAEYRHPFLIQRNVKNVGVIMISSDKGLCGGLNANVQRLAFAQVKEWEGAGRGLEACAIGNKGLVFLQRIGVNVLSEATALGDTPHLDRLIGPVKLLLDAYLKGEIDELFIIYTRFVNTMKQEPVMEQLLPLVGKVVGSDGHSNWDYVYEPEAKIVLDDLLKRYIEALIYQSVAENMASEQSARMVAMKSASDNAKNVIDELKLVYNKARQAAITKELSEIVGGAAAV